MKLAAIFLLIAVMSPAQSARVLTRKEARQVVIPAPVPRIGIPFVPPVWSGGELLSVIVNDTPEPVLNVTHANGQNEEFRFRFPDWNNLVIVGLSGREEGEIVAGGYGVRSDGMNLGFVARIAANREKRSIIAVEAIAIRVMTIGPGEVTWAVGPGVDKETGEKRDNILVRLAPDGKLLASTMLQLPAIKGSADVATGSLMRASSDRIAWLTSRNDYIEFSTDGSELTHIAGPANDRKGERVFGGFTLSYGSSPLIASLTQPARGQPSKYHIWTLDRVNQSWFQSEPADGEFPPGTALYGFDGELLISGYRDPRLGQMLIRYALSESR